MTNTNIYILRLEGGRWYIGKSDDVLNRYQQHIAGNGSVWTKKYKPISVHMIINNVSSFEEDKLTKEYMSKYGINKVRGGSYTQIKLSKFHKDAITMEIWAAKGLCTQCGRPGHFVKECTAKIDILGNTLDNKTSIPYGADSEDSTASDDEDYQWRCRFCDKTFLTTFGCGVHQKSCESNYHTPVKLCKIINV